MSNLSRVIKAFSTLRVLVIGEAILDRYLYGSASRFCQETPVPVVTLSACENQPGGAANTAANLRSLGTQVTLLSVIGNDEEGRLLQHALLNAGIDTSSIVVASDRATLTKQRVMDGDRLLLRFDQGSTDRITAALEQQLIHHLIHHFSDYDTVVISDYGYGILTPRVIDTIAHLQAQYSKTLVIDAKALEIYKILNATAVKPNYQQITQLLDSIELETQSSSRAEWIVAQTHRILTATGAQIVAVTLDQDGAIILQHQKPPYRIEVNPACPTRTIGAGDTFTATLAIALTAGASPSDAADLAAAAAAIVINKTGTSLCSDIELNHYFLSAAHHF